MTFKTRLVLPLLVFPVVSACSFSFSSGGLDYDHLQAQINDKLTAEYQELGHAPAAVECPHPKPAPKTGDTFVCTTHVDGNDDDTVRVEVTVGDDDTVKFQTLDTLYDLPIAGERLGEEITKNQGFPVTVECGDGVRIVANGDSFECVATDPQGKNRTVRLTAGGVEAGDSWEMLA